MPGYILAALSLAELLASSLSLSKNGKAQPSAISDAISKLTQLIESGVSLVSPNSVENILTDLFNLLQAAETLLPADVQARLNTVNQLLQKSQASIKNLASGQVAEVCVISMSFDGKEVPVDVFAIRRDSTANVAQDLGLAS